MKKLIALLLALALVFSLTGCQVVVDILTVLAEEEEYNYVDYTTALATTPVVTQAPSKAPEAMPTPTVAMATTPAPADAAIDEDGSYTSKEDVALYIHTYGRLPKNFITKSEARKLGWQSGSLERFAPGMCIGGDRFGNYEGLLPKKSGRAYTECDIDTLGRSSRGAKRIVFSNDGLIYYTDDHYESFTLLYGEE